jgi:SAM-dependent methyltransferase
MENSTLTTITTCEVCGSNDLKSVLDLGLHPMCDDLVHVGEDRTCKEFPIEILFCERCITAHQKYQIPKAELFPKSYHYRSRFTADVLNGMADLVQSMETRLKNISGQKVLDVGCNDGSLLDIFKSKGALTFGVEPTGAYADAEKKGHTVLNDFFSVETANKIVAKHGKMDFVTFTNVFAHIEDLKGLLEALKVIMHDGSVLVIENHYLGAVLDRSQFDTFYHEHPRTYSYTSFEFIGKSLGFNVSYVEFPSRYGGNIRVFLSKSAAIQDAEMKTIREKEGKFYSLFQVMNKKMQQWIASKKAFIKKRTAGGEKILAKAFPGRAAILVKLLGLNSNEIGYVFEKPGSIKIGHYLPGTRIPIASDDELFAKYKDKPLLNLAWHIPREIREYLKANGHTGEVIDVIEQSDFNDGGK